MKIIGVVLLFFYLITTGCGIKGPPLPPESETTIQKQKAAEETQKEAQKQKVKSGA